MAFAGKPPQKYLLRFAVTKKFERKTRTRGSHRLWTGNRLTIRHPGATG
jgi:hypothetical protein